MAVSFEPTRAPATDMLGKIAPHWRAPLLRLILATLVVGLVFGREWLEMFDQWWNSSTYNHILLIPAILAWLVIIRRHELAQMRPTVWPPALLMFAGAVLLWVLGQFSGINLADHLAVVVMLQALVILLLGPKIAWALLFPLAYMLFLVPFGNEMVPFLQMLTAKITIFLTNLSGVPAYIDGVFIDTPAGLFVVAEACSGVKFLVAMVALGTLVAHLGFKRWGKRVAYMGLAVVFPILANGVRAWGTVYVAQFAGIEFAASFDHIFYGWIFFALIMAVMLAVAWYFFDRDPSAPFVDLAAIERSSLLKRVAGYSMDYRGALLALGVIMLAASLWANTALSQRAPLPQKIALPNIKGWQQTVYQPQIPWEPRASGSDRRLLGRYRSSKGQIVDVFFAAYETQGDGKEAAGFGEGALNPDSDWSWRDSGVDIAGVPSEWLQAFRTRRIAVTRFANGDARNLGGTDLRVNLLFDRLLLRPEPTGMLVISSAEITNNPDPQGALEDFLSDSSGPAALVAAIMEAG